MHMKDSNSFLKPYLRGWPIIVGAMVLAYLAAGKYLNYVTPMYESTAKLRLADMSEGVPNGNLFKDFDVFVSTQKINAEIELLKSHTLIRKALHKIPFEVQISRAGSVRKTELFYDSPILISALEWPEVQKDKTYTLQVADNRQFTVIAPDGKGYKGALGDTLTIGSGGLMIRLNETLFANRKQLQIADNYEFTIASLNKQISQIQSRLDVIAVDKDVPVIRISYKSAHPDKAAIFPNALAEAYIEDYIENKYGAANTTADFLDGRIADISDKLSASEQSILGYRDDKGITNIRQETETDLRKISQLKIQLTNLKMNLEAIRELENYIQSGKKSFLDLAPNFEAFTDLLSTEMVKKIKQLQAEKKDLLLQYTPKDEKVRVVDAKIQDLSSYLIESISNTRRNLETKYEKLEADIAEAERVFVDVPEKERMMTILNREFEIYQQSYNFLNQKKIEADIAKAAKIAFHRIITPAFVSREPVSPNRSIIRIVSAMLGLIAAIALIFIVHTIKARVNNAAAIEAQSMLPVLAAVPRFNTALEKEHYFIRTLNEWEVKGRVKEGSILCFSGANREHGARFIAEELFRIMDWQKRKALFIEITDGSAATAALWQETASSEYTSRLSISSGALRASTAQFWKKFIREKAGQYEFTLILNSVIGDSHTLASMAAADLNLVCLDARRTPLKMIREIDLIQAEYQLPQPGFALNRAGYNPGILGEALRFIQKLLNRKPANLTHTQA